MSGPQKTILAVDDENDITEMLALLLESEGYRVLTEIGSNTCEESIDPQAVITLTNGEPGGI